MNSTERSQLKLRNTFSSSGLELFSQAGMLPLAVDQFLRLTAREQKSLKGEEQENWDELPIFKQKLGKNNKNFQIIHLIIFIDYKIFYVFFLNFGSFVLRHSFLILMTSSFFAADFVRSLFSLPQEFCSNGICRRW
jgi:hypothetical protein